VYSENFRISHEFNTDVTSTDDNVEAVPDHDLLLAGFPCQPFSHAGKKMGFEDTRGTLFFSIANIAKQKRPKVLLLENVRGLKSHDKGKTLETIQQTLIEIGYSVHVKILNARDFGLPQNRNRLFIVAIRDDIPGNANYVFPEPQTDPSSLTVAMILEAESDLEKLTISDRLWQGHQERKLRNVAAGKGFGFQLVERESSYTATLSARYYKDGSEILLKQPNRNPRLLSVREAANLQGFPKAFVLHPSKKEAYKQLGNAVPVNVISAIAKTIMPYLQSQ
jgi:DNA (cytosine-5)-methyltransferase 1